MRFNTRYFIAAMILFLTEAFIAAFMHDGFIRPVFGDFLIVILVYCGLRSVFVLSYKSAIIISTVFCYVVEVLQYFHLIRLLGLEKSIAAQLILGSGFSWGDMLAYTLGAVVVLIVEYARLDVSKELKTICQEDL